eukprot:765580-Hanusia_phi.AAC.1
MTLESLRSSTFYLVRVAPVCMLCNNFISEVRLMERCDRTPHQDHGSGEHGAAEGASKVPSLQENFADDHQSSHEEPSDLGRSEEDAKARLGATLEGTAGRDQSHVIILVIVW